uniref:Zgc:123060 n=1 Tax=Nothobranchius korthausae TaxID=1143690 RepID=A0A1A8HKY0_9TELE
MFNVNFRTGEFPQLHSHVCWKKVCLLSSCLRSLLAVLDYNHHNHRPDYITRKNEKSYKRLYSYIPELQCCILRKLMDVGALPRKAKRNPGDPRNLGNLAGVVAPPTAELVQTQIRRGQVKLKMTVTRLDGALLMLLFSSLHKVFSLTCNQLHLFAVLDLCHQL